MSIGDPVLHRDQIELVLEALPSKFDLVVAVVNSRSELFTLDELESLLLFQESLIDKMKKEVVDAVTVNLTQSVPQSPSPQENCTDSQNPSQFNMNFGGRSNQSRGRADTHGYTLSNLNLKTLTTFTQFKALVQLQLNHKTKAIQADGGDVTHSASTNSVSPSSSSLNSAPAPKLHPSNTHRMLTRAKDGIVQPRFQPTLLLTHVEPTSYKQALDISDWFIAMQA
ncbi:hypothetical protein KIW84_050764 [Lathyrus oleraceus]|uniref:Uncharacterized protein n=1 Tax=Pisum sativum TaxID=3888 RepID=A0A9D4WKM1_PEA|nr:hypothetical protein KIW84_050764 [Pisum sativum]